MIDRLKPADLTVAHSFQTNGTLLDEAWCAFFGEERGQCRSQRRRPPALA
jgi:sulfatase maturation enzyme AslB (radical SAM superfamily)